MLGTTSYSPNTVVTVIARAWLQPCRPPWGRGLMYLLYPKNSTLRWLRAIPTPRSKNVHNFLMTERPLSWACGHRTESKKLFSTWLLSDIFRYDSPNKCPTILYAVNLWLKPVSATGATVTKHLYIPYRNVSQGAAIMPRHHQSSWHLNRAQAVTYQQPYGSLRGGCTALHSQKAVNISLKSKQLLPFSFARQFTLAYVLLVPYM